RRVARDTRDRRDALTERRHRDFGRGGEIHGSVFLIEEQEIETRCLRDQADLDGPKMPDAEAQRDAAGLELLPGMIGGNWHGTIRLRGLVLADDAGGGQRPGLARRQ